MLPTCNARPVTLGLASLRKTDCPTTENVAMGLAIELLDRLTGKQPRQLALIPTLTAASRRRRDLCGGRRNDVFDYPGVKRLVISKPQSRDQEWRWRPPADRQTELPAAPPIRLHERRHA